MDIYIWGTGRLVGKVLGEFIEENQISGFIDNDVSKKSFMGKPVFSPQEIKKMEYDAILVITIYSKEIYEQSMELQLELDKMIFVYNNFVATDININYVLAERIFGKEYSNIIKNRYLLVRRNEAAEMSGRVLSASYSETDYVRIKTFELVTEEIRQKKLNGAVAEVGVFRGEFAQYINAAFPEKKCYLFDTFEGFGQKEAQEEIRKGHATDTFIEVYRDESIKFVMDRMLHPEMVEIRKGLFPDSLNGLEEQFSFVSIDVDFERSIYECMDYFYPRVEKGGYIFVHDYNSSLAGVKKAVRQYEKSLGETLHAVPLCDANGTLVIMK